MEMYGKAPKTEFGFEFLGIRVKRGNVEAKNVKDSQELARIAVKVTSWRQLFCVFLWHLSGRYFCSEVTAPFVLLSKLKSSLLVKESIAFGTAPTIRPS